jgi:acetyl-CoA carboxylase alpha subunit
VAESIRAAVERHLNELVGIGIDDLLEQRYRRIQSFGRYSERN